jgi:hypothetical protein
LYGPDFLVAPIYQDTKSDKDGNDIRNGIYLPKGTWVDYFSGDKYEGNRILNNFDAPLWKLPVFIKNGAIIPMANPNNHVSEINKGLRIYEIYPYGNSSFTEYDDDGTTEKYKIGKSATTLIESNVDKSNVKITVHPTKGNFKGFFKEKATEFKINVTRKPKKIKAKVDGKKVKLAEVNSITEFEKKENIFFYNASPDLNQFATKGSEFAKKVITKNPQLLVKLASIDITKSETVLEIEGFEFEPSDKYRITSGALTAPTTARVEDTNATAFTLLPTWNKVPNADFYEIKFNEMLYSTIKDTELLFDGLDAETNYSFKIRSVNKDGYSDWIDFKATTKANPLEFAIPGIVGETTSENQGRSGINKLFDFDEGTTWHTKWGVNSIPFDLIMDLKTINQLDKFHYLPRSGGGNGVLLKGTVYFSNDKENWTEAGMFEWANDDAVKVFDFPKHPTARYLKLSITNGVGGFGSGSELYVFKVPNSPSYIPGDINNDHLIDRNDLTSYINYTGLRMGDADFEGYISNGDLNKNNLIDAYDISVLATQLDGGVDKKKIEKVSGTIQLRTAKQTYNKGEIVEIMVKGTNLRNVNALSFALPYNSADYEFVGVQSLNMLLLDTITNKSMKPKV